MRRAMVDLPAALPPPIQYTCWNCFWASLVGCNSTLSALRCDFVVSYDLVLDALQILEKDRVVAGLGVFRVLAGRAHNRGSYSLKFEVQPVHFRSRLYPERKMVKGARLPAVHCLVRIDAERRGDRKAQARMLIRHYPLLVP